MNEQLEKLVNQKLEEYINSDKFDNILEKFFIAFFDSIDDEFIFEALEAKIIESFNEIDTKDIIKLITKNNLKEKK